MGQVSTGLLAGFDLLIGLIVVVTLTGAVATVTNAEMAHAVGALGFGIAFVLLTVGRSELFTENFLVPVGAFLAGRGTIGGLMRLWGLTLIFNFVGAAILAAILSVDGVLPASAYAAAGDLADTFATRDYGNAFASAVLAGVAMTLYTWLTMAARAEGARIALAMIIGFVLLLPMLNHVVVGYGELVLGVFAGASSPGLGESLGHIGVAMAGNIVGGIGFITITRLVQVTGEPHDPGHQSRAREAALSRRQARQGS